MKKTKLRSKIENCIDNCTDLKFELNYLASSTANGETFVSSKWQVLCYIFDFKLRNHNSNSQDQLYVLVAIVGESGNKFHPLKKKKNPFTMTT